ncbi:MAG: hypothetical protein K940chlam2_01828, partial [Chlamydiae bacterium]|nr:hypothetical protein [Chlamydiota bacterium]
VSAAIAQNPEAIQYASERIKNNPELLQESERAYKRRKTK